MILIDELFQGFFMLFVLVDQIFPFLINLLLDLFPIAQTGFLLQGSELLEVDVKLLDSDDLVPISQVLHLDLILPGDCLGHFFVFCMVVVEDLATKI